jgi:2-polyprenyl-3-methyl-5-hydroxy-6-metoxy-1,4-benzoquinol methylase
MGDVRDIDLDQLMEQMRLKIREKRAMAESASSPQSHQRNAEWQHDMAHLHNAYDLGQADLRSGRKRLVGMVHRAAEAAKGLLAPIIQRQSEYNAANTRVVTHLSAEIKSLQDRLNAALEEDLRRSEENKTYLQSLARRLSKTYADDLAMHAQSLSEVARNLTALEQRLAALEQRQNSTNERLQWLDRQHEELEQLRTYYEQLKLVRERLLRMERRLRKLASPGADGGPAVRRPEAAPPEPEMDYFGFEDRLRDSAMVKDKQRGYLQYFAGKAPVIDAGCGKGEFLELLREAGIQSRGIDLNPDMVLECKEKGLDADNGDAIEYLSRQSDGSLGGIFSAQVIEHLTSPQLNALVGISWRKLRPGGVIVLETLNPESLFVHWRWFWMDPSHVRLVHPQTLQFMLESVGFVDICCEFLEPPHHGMPIPQLHAGGGGELEDFNRATDYLNKLLYGSWEYALIGKR